MPGRNQGSAPWKFIAAGQLPFNVLARQSGIGNSTSFFWTELHPKWGDRTTFLDNRSISGNLQGSWILIKFQIEKNTTLTGGVVVFSLPFAALPGKGHASSHPGWMFNPAHRLSNQQQLLIVFGRCTTGTSKQKIAKPQETYLSARSRFSRCDAVRCDAMRGHAMQSNAITIFVWAMYRNQYRILYALPGKHDTWKEIEFCDRSFHLSNAQGDAASNWNCFGLGSWVALLLMQSWTARVFFQGGVAVVVVWWSLLLQSCRRLRSNHQYRRRHRGPGPSLTRTATFCVVCVGGPCSKPNWNW